MGATGEEPVQPPIRVWSGPPGWPFRVDAFYMKANYAGKVSNLTVTPHRNISLNILNTITNITEAPFS